MLLKTFIRCVAGLAVATSAAGQPAQDSGWTVVSPGGETGCGFEAPFEFWVRPGDPQRLLLHLQGGGACWNLETCDPQRAIAFDRKIDSTDHRQRRDGIFDRASGANPFREYTTVFVPYCTGDFHLGTRRVHYPAPPNDSGSGVTVRHIGYHNVRAVLDYIAARPVKPGLVVVSGASAGAVASPVVADQIARQFPAAAVRQVGDGVAGLRVAEARGMLRQWGVDSLMNALGTPLATSGDAFVSIYKAVAARNLGIRFSQVSTDSDALVTTWLGRFGYDPTRLAANIATTYGELRDALGCFTGYVLPGTQHTTLWRPEALTAEASGQRLLALLDREVVQRPCDHAQMRGREDAVSPSGDAAFLFAYKAKQDMAAEFTAGYRRHLDWHAAHNDSLTWLGWSVVDGRGIGTFVDGAFGVRFKAIDERVAPQGDAADAARNVTAFATPVDRQVLRLRRDLSSSTRLEQGRPAAMQRVAWLTLRPGSTRAFEEALLHIVRRAPPEYALYERISGGAQPAFALIVQLASWADLDDFRSDPLQAIVRDAGASIAHIDTEVWLYRPDMTYIPAVRRRTIRPPPYSPN